MPMLQLSTIIARLQPPSYYDDSGYLRYFYDVVYCRGDTIFIYEERGDVEKGLSRRTAICGRRR